jgi:glycosyltransferase involved in cell wall biosynthesis
MTIIAIIAARNEELYLERCIRHLRSQGILTCIINHGSTDRTRHIAESFMDDGVCRIVDEEYCESFDLFAMLRLKERLSLEMEADWFIHCDADEIREAPQPYATLREGIEAADLAGYNAINFEEFVFIPTADSDRYEGTDYVQKIKHYYYFSPSPLRRVNAWKKTQDVDLATSAGHHVRFENQRIFPTNFILRHYIILSAEHGRMKYGFNRKFLPTASSLREWHGWRARFKQEMIKLPPPAELKKYFGDRVWDCSDPKTRHIFIQDTM